MAPSRIPGSTCGTKEVRGCSPSPGPTRSGPHESLSVKVEVDQRTNTRTLIFSKAVSPLEGSNFLWGNPANAALLKPIGSPAAGKAQVFVLDAHGATIMSLRPEVQQAIMLGSILRSNAKPYDFPQWVPVNIQTDIRSQRLPKGVTRYPGPAQWGDFVVWTGNVTVQIYLEFPSDLGFYSRIARGDDRLARGLHFAYTDYNKSMHFWVEEKGLPPEDARSEIRRTNDETLLLVVEGAAFILAAGAGILQVSNAMQANAEEVAGAARRSPRFRAAAQKIRPAGGGVNIGGSAGETPQYTNLNPLSSETSGGPSTALGIENFVKGKMEEMDQIFEAGSVNEITSSKLRFVDFNWDAATQAAARAMRPGGKVGMNVWCTEEKGVLLKAAFERAGFQNVTITGEGVGTMISAVR